jgi:3-hydroxyisobutyrate dehydrogenase
VAATPADLATAVEIVITFLSDAAAIDATFRGSSGLLAGDVRGKLFIDMSTVRGADHCGLAPTVEAKGALFLECPVSGTVQPAREGKLFGFAGGQREAFEAALPLLQDLCRRVELVGAMGAGTSMKLAANLLLTVFWQALAEACGLMRDITIEPQRLIQLLADTNIGAGMLTTRGGLVSAALAGRPAPDASFDIDFMRKDLREMLEEAGELDLSLPAAQATLACFDDTARAGAGKIDATQYPAWWLSHTHE